MKKICRHCGTEFEGKVQKAAFCSNTCKIVAYSEKKFPDGSDYVQCQICGLRGRQLIQHITKVHEMTVKEYCQTFGVDFSGVQAKSLSEQMSSGIKKAHAEGRCGFQKGGDNPSKKENCRNGRNSAWSTNFKGYDGLSDEEKTVRIKALGERAQASRNSRHNNATKIDYYLARGYSEQDAKKALRERQQTFTLEKCVAKYGEEEGRRIYEDRQRRWQDTMKSKPVEEIERINKAKASQSRNVVAFSKISQVLFNSVYEKIKNRYNNIYYATLDTGNQNTNNNHEYEVILEDGIHRYFLDFYVEDNNKVIEFDGDYWHSEKRGNQKRDAEREANLRRLGYTDILRIRERDYNADPDAVVKRCVEFIIGSCS